MLSFFVANVKINYYTTNHLVFFNILVGSNLLIVMSLLHTSVTL